MMNLLGTIQTIDLSSGRSDVEPFPESVEEQFLAGRGFAVYRLRREVCPGTDPLGPGNALILSCGLLAATAAPASSRLHLCGLSPLTGLLGSSNIGGSLADRMRGCGIQALVLTGRAPKPSIVLIRRRGIEIVDAGSLWGTDTWEAEDLLKRRYSGSRPAVLTIGPAGENRVPLACIVSDRDHAAGRTGLGAVMGAKNLKAVVVCGGESGRQRGTERQRRAVSEYARRIRRAPEFAFFARNGGAGYTVWCSEKGFAGAYNYRRPVFDQVEKIDGTLLSAQRHRSRGCPRCPVRCKAELRRAGKPPAFRPEFESMINLGAKCGLSDLDALVGLDNLCTRLGLDVISAATVLSFAMDLAERGMLPDELGGGDGLFWGKPAAMERLIRQMAAAEGPGEFLGQGVRRIGERIGGEAERRAPHVKGLELCGYHPGFMMGTALAYAVSSRGGDFNNLYAAMEYGWTGARGAAAFGTAASVDSRSCEGKGKLIRRAAVLTCALDSLGLCKVPALSLVGDFDLENEAELTAALTGKAIGAEALFEVGERIVNLERRFNLEHGLDPRVDDRLPEVFFAASPAKDGGPLLTPEGFERMRQEFYSAMGWDQSGRPDGEPRRRPKISVTEAPAAGARAQKRSPHSGWTERGVRSDAASSPGGSAREPG